MELVDTHCHIQSIGLRTQGEAVTRQLWAKAGDLTADGVIRAAADAGVTRLICVGCDLADSQLAIDFVQKRDNCWATIGIHPHEAGEALVHGRILPQFAALAHENKVVAVGECGLDYYYEHSSKPDQRQVLEFQIALAIEADLPLIFHVRDAFDDFWPIFDACNTTKQPIRGVLHSFTDSAKNLDKALERNLHIGVNGIATFAKNLAQLEVYRRVPLQKLLLETDAPFLTPVPYRGTINEPKYIGEVAHFIARLRGESLQTLAKTTTDNARALFGL
jgi:TatD DNase family protein